MYYNDIKKSSKPNNLPVYIRKVENTYIFLQRYL